MLTNKAYNYIGLAARAGRIASGAESVQHAVRSGKAKLMLLDTKASDNAKKSYRAMSENYGVPIIVLDSPGAAAGKPAHICIAICDSGLAKAIIEKISTNNTGGKG